MSETTKIKTAIADQVGRIRTALNERAKNVPKSPLAVVAEETGLHPNTIRNIAKGNGQSFSLATIEKLETYLFGGDKA
jgi:hypothetical protein